jgi:hypothetical protein
VSHSKLSQTAIDLFCKRFFIDVCRFAYDAGLFGEGSTHFIFFGLKKRGLSLTGFRAA